MLFETNRKIANKVISLSFVTKKILLTSASKCLSKL